jgi:hypothetical protein
VALPAGAAAEEEAAVKEPPAAAAGEEEVGVPQLNKLLKKPREEALGAGEGAGASVPWDIVRPLEATAL